MLLNRRQFNYALMGSLLVLPFRGIPLPPAPAVNGQRILDHILALAEFGKNPQGGVSRGRTVMPTNKGANTCSDSCAPQSST